MMMAYTCFIDGYRIEMRGIIGRQGRSSSSTSGLVICWQALFVFLACSVKGEVGGIGNDV